MVRRSFALARVLATDDRGSSAGSEGRIIMVPASNVQVLVATKRVNFRRGADHLAALVRLN
jgi:hypothetical protein